MKNRFFALFAVIFAMMAACNANAAAPQAQPHANVVYNDGDVMNVVVNNPGEGVMSLLRASGAFSNANVEKFYKLNPRVGNHPSHWLILGQTYVVPVELHNAFAKNFAVSPIPTRTASAKKSAAPTVSNVPVVSAAKKSVAVPAAVSAAKKSNAVSVAAHVKPSVTSNNTVRTAAPVVKAEPKATISAPKTVANTSAPAKSAEKSEKVQITVTGPVNQPKSVMNAVIDPSLLRRGNDPAPKSTAAAKSAAPAVPQAAPEKPVARAVVPPAPQAAQKSEARKAAPIASVAKGVPKTAAVPKAAQKSEVKKPTLVDRAVEKLTALVNDVKRRDKERAAKLAAEARRSATAKKNQAPASQTAPSASSSPVTKAAGLPAAEAGKKPRAPLIPVVFTASPYTIKKGQSAMLNWIAFNTDGAKLNGIPVETVGKRDVSPNATTEYTLVIRKGAHSVSETLKVEVVEEKGINAVFGSIAIASVLVVSFIAIRKRRASNSTAEEGQT